MKLVNKNEQLDRDLDLLNLHFRANRKYGETILEVEYNPGGPRAPKTDKNPIVAYHYTRASFLDNADIEDLRMIASIFRGLLLSVEATVFFARKELKEEFKLKNSAKKIELAKQ